MQWLKCHDPFCLSTSLWMYRFITWSYDDDEIAFRASKWIRHSMHNILFAHVTNCETKTQPSRDIYGTTDRVPFYNPVRQPTTEGNDNNGYITNYSYHYQVVYRLIWTHWVYKTLIRCILSSVCWGLNQFPQWIELIKENLWSMKVTKPK